MITASDDNGCFIKPSAVAFDRKEASKARKGQRTTSGAAGSTPYSRRVDPFATHDQP